MRTVAMTTAALVMMIVVGLGAETYRLSHKDTGTLIAYASQPDGAFDIDRWLSWYLLKRIDECPTKDFRPTSPLTYMVNAWDSGLDASPSRKLFALLQDRGCDINALDHSGLSPLHTAVLSNNPEIVAYLLERGADPRIETRIQLPGPRNKVLRLPAGAFAKHLQDKSRSDYRDVMRVLSKAH